MPTSRKATTNRMHVVFDTFIRPAVYGATVPIDVEAHHVHGEPITYAEARAARYEPFAVGDAWGGAWDTTWFRLTTTVPAEWAGEEAVLRLNLGLGNAPGFGGEALVWEDGQPQQGISAFHGDYPVARPARGGDVVELFVEAAANPAGGRFNGGDAWPALLPDYNGAPLFKLRQAEVAVFRRPVWDFMHDVRVLMQLADALPDDEPRHGEVVRALNESFALLDPNDVPGSLAGARPPLFAALAQPSRSAHRISAVGHAHIDTAWLWPLRETARKAARTFSTAVRLMDEYPDYQFLASQPQQYEWIRDRYPELFERMRRQVKAGRFEPVGGMWVEADCNIPSGESLVRQLLYGKRFFMDEFGCEPREVWLPDVFGYAAQLPQLMVKAGISWFLTQKLSWNDTNRFPHSTFTWEGLDGSRVTAHFPPADTYNGDFSVRQLRWAVSNFREHGVSDRSLYLYGYGDGGGGPTRDMLESAKRMKDLDGLPAVALEGAAAFFEQATAEAGPLPLWVGELYFEFHRGTYTSQGATKLGNRRSEGLLRDAELLAVVAPTPYPADELSRAWKTVLLNQFHDIIPGSSIQWVYEDAARDYAAIASAATGVIDRSAAAIGATLDTAGCEEPVVLINSASFDRDEVVEIEVVEIDAEIDAAGPSAAVHAIAPDGRALRAQRLASGRVAVRASVPSVGYAVYDVRKGDAPASTSATTPGAVELDEHSLENELLRVAWDDEGLLTSVWNKRAGREALAPGARGNLLQLFHDYPAQFDAWDIDPSYRDHLEELTAIDDLEIVEDGPLRGAVRIRRSFGDSWISQVMSLDAGSGVVRFDTEVEWQERHRLLKAAFPLAIRSPRASYEVQFGYLERPTHRNTSWDAAKFEVCGQRWADLSEAGFGVAVVNDCKYGHDCEGNVLRLSLLRGPTAPDPDADRGRHRFAYGLYPHQGDVTSGGVVERGIAFNQPIRSFAAPSRARDAREARGADGGRSGSWFRVEGDAVLDTVKQAEDRDDAVVVRLYEPVGGRGRVVLTSSLRLRGASTADLLERPLAPVEVHDGRVSFDIAPFEVVTLVLDVGAK